MHYPAFGLHVPDDRNRNQRDKNQGACALWGDQTKSEITEYTGNYGHDSWRLFVTQSSADSALGGAR